MLLIRFIVCFLLQIYSFFLKLQFFHQFFFTLPSFFLRERFTPPPFLPSRNVRLERLEDLEGLEALEGLDARDYEDSLARVQQNRSFVFLLSQVSHEPHNKLYFRENQRFENTAYFIFKTSSKNDTLF